MESSRRLSFSLPPPQPRAQRLAVDPKHIADGRKRKHAVGAVVEEPFSRLD